MLPPCLCVCITSKVGSKGDLRHATVRVVWVKWVKTPIIKCPNLTQAAALTHASDTGAQLADKVRGVQAEGP